MFLETDQREYSINKLATGCTEFLRDAIMIYCGA